MSQFYISDVKGCSLQQSFDENRSPISNSPIVSSIPKQSHPKSEIAVLRDCSLQEGSERRIADKTRTENDYENKQHEDRTPQIGIGRSVQEIARKFYSTTSSVYAEHTISNPNAEQILFCISTVLQAQVFEDLDASPDSKLEHPEFNHSSLLISEDEGMSDVILDEVLVRESENDEELRQKLQAGTVPTVESIFRFITLLKEHARYPTECNIIALIYTNRMTSMGSMPLTMQNWRAIWVIAIILAQKMWDDQPLKTSSFAHMLPTFTKQLLRNLEVKALNLIQFSSGVKPSLYAQYYFELRTLFSEIKGATSAASNDWTLKPLSIIKARRLEDRSANVWEKSKLKTVSKSRSASISSRAEGTPKTPSQRASSAEDREVSAASARKGWQTSSPSQGHAHARTQMMGLHEESKGKNFNPYVYDARQRSGTAVHRSLSEQSCSSSTSPILSPQLVEATSTTASMTGVDHTGGWVCSDVQRGDENVVRTYEDITLTDTSRFVLS